MATQRALGYFGFTLAGRPAELVVPAPTAVDLTPEMWLAVFDAIGCPAALLVVAGVCHTWRGWALDAAVRVWEAHDELYVGRRNSYEFVHGDRIFQCDWAIGQTGISMSIGLNNVTFPGRRVLHMPSIIHRVELSLALYNTCASCDKLFRQPPIIHEPYAFCSKLCVRLALAWGLEAIGERKAKDKANKKAWGDY